MKSVLLSFLLLATAAQAQVPTNVQKLSGVLSNGSLVVGNNTSITATGTGQIIATGGAASSLPYTGITLVPTVSLLGNPTGGTANASAITLGASLQFVSSALNTIQAITTAATPTFAGLTLSGLTTNHGLVTTNGSGLLSTTLTPTGLTSVNGLALTSTAATLDVASGSSLQTLGGYTEALTFTANTAVTFPTSGTLATTAGTVAPSGSINTNGVGYWVGANSLASTAALASGQILIGSSGVAPVPAAINSTNGGVQVQNGAGSITMALQSAIYGPTSVGVNTGTTAAATALQVVDTGTASPRGITNDQYNTGTNSAQFNARKARGTFATPTTIVTGDILARFLAWGHDGSNFIESGNLRFTSTGTIAATRVPSQAEIWTSTNALPSVLTKAATFGADQSLAVVGPVSASNLSLGGTLTTANSLTTTGNFSLALTTTANTSLTLPTSGTLATTSQIPSLPVSGANGGTGVANTGLTVTLGGNVSTANSLTTTGNFSLALATTGATSVTLPTTGTLATTSQIASGANPTATISSAAGTVTNGSASTFLRSDGAPALPATMTGVNSVTSAAGTALTLGTGTTGTALTVASATNIATFSAGLIGQATTEPNSPGTSGALILSGGIGMSIGGNRNAAFWTGSAQDTIFNLVNTNTSGTTWQWRSMGPATGNITGGSTIFTTGASNPQLELLKNGGVNVWDGSLSVQENAGTTSTDGLVSKYRADSAATVGSPVRYSPRLRWGASAWNSVSVAAEDNNFKAEVIPVAAAGTTSASWNLGYANSAVSSGAYTNLLTVSSAGVVNHPGTVSASSAITGTVTVGNGTAATNVGIGGGNIVAGATVTAGGLAETLATFKGTVTLTAGAGTITSAAITSTAVVILSRTTTSGAGVYPQIDVGSGSATITGTATDGGTYNWRVIQ